MRVAKKGDTVRVHYRGKLQDGSIFDETFDRAPFGFDATRPRIRKYLRCELTGFSVNEQIFFDRTFHDDFEQVICQARFLT